MVQRKFLDLRNRIKRFVFAVMDNWNQEKKSNREMWGQICREVDIAVLKKQGKNEGNIFK